MVEKIAERLLLNMSAEARNAHLEVAPTLPAECMGEARLYPNRAAMLHALPKGGEVGEVGTFRGDFSAVIANVCKPDVFHLFDIDFEPFKDPPGNLIKYRGDSSFSLSGLPEDKLDWLYIDGDHSYEAVVKDLRAADRVLKPGGYLMCNDYTNWCSPSVAPYGVARAVNEFIVDHRYSIEGLALHAAGLPDLLIRKPL